MDETWDVVVVGGGAAGLSAALVLGRARRRTLVVDSGAPSNAPAHGIGGLLGQDGRPPTDFYADGRRELEQYPTVEVRTGAVVTAKGERGDFRLELDDGTAVVARRLLLATGMDYRYPDVPGVAERWGGMVFHCPFCHGWEVRDRPLVVLDDGDGNAEHRRTLLQGWSDDVTVLAVGDVAGIEDDGVRLADGTLHDCGGVLVPVTMHQRSDLPEQLGVALVPTGLAPDAIGVDATNATSVPGIWAAGDLDPVMPSVAAAIASGHKAAAMIVKDSLGA
ncbi:MAG TPA: NAD(P)/FAD-dependent oxidoreductase [Acidimicrobiales bacterium]|nr:NAD(P)/FAD-dependent oxidoreductase [Acidimicrobiales bacterium]